MQRLFLDFDGLGNDEIIISDREIYHQIATVLRAKIGFEVVFFDGKRSLDFVYSLLSFDKKNLIFSLKNRITKDLFSKKIHLHQALLNKQEKIEWILQKGCEVGYTSFHFFRSERSQVFHLTQSKQTRFERIIIEAIEQSGRNFIPELHFYENGDLSQNHCQKIVFHTSTEALQLLTQAEISDVVEVRIGPEGGFSQKEIEECMKG